MWTRDLIYWGHCGTIAKGRRAWGRLPVVMNRCLGRPFYSLDFPPRGGRFLLIPTGRYFPTKISRAKDPYPRRGETGRRGVEKEGYPSAFSPRGSRPNGQKSGGTGLEGDGGGRQKQEV